MSDPLLPPIVDRGRHAPEVSSPVENSGLKADSNEKAEGIGSNRPLIFAMLFGVTGALGLPLLWYSPAFSRREKWIWSIINCIYTAALIAIAIISLRVIFNAMQTLA